MIANKPPTKQDLRELLDMHARLSRSKGRSYEEVAREIGSLVVFSAIVWVLSGAPGVPAVDAFASTRLAPHVQAGMMCLVLVFGGEVAGQGWYTAPELVKTLLRLPWKFLSSLVSAVVVLSGIACVGMAALIPGAYVVHLLGLNAG